MAGVCIRIQMCDEKLNAHSHLLAKQEKQKWETRIPRPICLPFPRKGGCPAAQHQSAQLLA